MHKCIELKHLADNQRLVAYRRNPEHSQRPDSERDCNLDKF